MYDEFSSIQRSTRDNVEPDSAKAHAADKDRPLLLLHAHAEKPEQALLSDSQH